MGRRWPSRTWPCSCWRGSTTMRWRAQGRRLTIVCATSGDTGGAAVEAFRGRANVGIVALFPEGRISEVQRRFMTTADDDNVACLAVKGTFDDCQAMLKAMFRDAQFARGVDLSGVNSINFARIAAQSVYYFTAAVALGAPHRPVAFAVPTGNFGDAYAGYVAHRMGLPIERIVVAVNANDILARALETGRYARGEAAATSSPAMDIQVASNFERLLLRGDRPRRAGDRARLRGVRRAGRDRHPAPQPGRHAQPLRRRGGGRGGGGAHHPGNPQRDRRAGRSAHRRRPRRRRAHRAGRPGDAAGDARHRPSGQVPRGGRRRRRRCAADAGQRCAARPAAPSASSRSPPTSRPPRPTSGTLPRYDVDAALRPLRQPASRSATSPVVCATVEEMSRVHTLANGVRVVADPAPGFQTLALTVAAGRGARSEERGRGRLVAPAGAHGVQGRRPSARRATSSR